MHVDREVSPAIGWRRSSRCDTGACIEVGQADDTVVVRNSRDPDGPQLQFTFAEWRAFIAGARDGEFDFR
jgi:hypothetical protein